ncbi:type VII secretion-associated serine protease mycosin [Amycolatopsis magusensis]|uniref:Membrane-anchored mycosin MYCP n=1 Tax=Amycolatopsis magusensis TaxID=882444 RepID=A0ABS4PM69_9PSEU|nr:type VII secretion-associated serine protease mycosin [Amycolatopsis magusensis]MBP2180490.1 membrane-anchored mycosin MYCP [Amycolatopsis magusensis]MDI5979469.1 type VII secretion-associated serine protease mycosin [Amycolatopsis magusensis]
MRSFGTPARVATVLLTAAVGVLAPGLSPLTAGAQPGSPPPGTTPGTAPLIPPPVDMSKLPTATNRPDKNYAKKVECVSRDLDNDIPLPDIPWAQKYLQLDKVHDHMRAATNGHVGMTPTGAPIRVAVIDTGVTEHPAFGQPVQSGGDYVKTEGRGLEDCDGHGTEVAGIIGARKQDDIGFMGMAPDSQIVSIRQSSQNYQVDDKPPAAPPPASSGAPAPSGSQPPPSGGAEESGTEEPAESSGTAGASASDTVPGQGNQGRQQGGQGAGNLNTLAQAVVTAADLEGVKVINMSVDNCRPASGGGITPEERALQAAVRYAVNKDVVVVAAAGNTSEACKQNSQPDPNQPINIVSPPWFTEDVISVAAIDETGGVAQFSVNGPWVTVAAPGTNIISLDPSKNAQMDDFANQTMEGDQVLPIQGTSFAAPYVAGLATLIRAKFPDLNARQVMNRITSTSQHPGSRTGRDQFVGYGVINPMAALTAVIPGEDKIGLTTPFQQQIPAPAALPSDLPPANDGDRTPMIVALSGAAGGVVALLITLFVVHTVRRNRPAPTPQKST